MCETSTNNSDTVCKREYALWSPPSVPADHIQTKHNCIQLWAPIGRGDSLSYTEQQIGRKADAKHITWQSHGGQWAGQMMLVSALTKDEVKSNWIKSMWEVDKSWNCKLLLNSVIPKGMKSDGSITIVPQYIRQLKQNENKVLWPSKQKCSRHGNTLPMPISLSQSSHFYFTF